ncbi:MAG: Hpt domain-containing protein [Deltaproteobacteria bacterium]
MTDNNAEEFRDLPVWNKAWMLEHLMDDEDLVKEVLELFISSVPEQIQNVKNFLDEGDARKVQVQSHAIKGACSNVGGERLRAVALKIEDSARAGDLSTAGFYMAEMELQFENLRDEMAKELAKCVS